MKTRTKTPADRTEQNARALRTQMEWFAETLKTNRTPDGFQFNSIYAFILKHGREFTTPAGNKLPAGIRRERLGECFMNAYHLADCNPAMTYIEGYANCLGMAMDHAWCIDTAGNVVDPTWGGRGDHHKHTAYFGVAFPTQYVRDVVFEREIYGVLNNPEMGHPLMKHGMEGIE